MHVQHLLDQIQERAKTAGDHDVPQLAKALQAVLAKCASMERGVGYRVSGQHDTWDEYHEGMSDMAGYIEEAITEAIGADDA